MEFVQIYAGLDLAGARVSRSPSPVVRTRRVAIVAVACSAVAVPLNPKLTLDEIETGFATLRPDAVVLLCGSDTFASKRPSARAWPLSGRSSKRGNPRPQDRCAALEHTRTK